MLKRVLAVLVAMGLTFVLAIAPVAAFAVESAENENGEEVIEVIEIVDEENEPEEIIEIIKDEPTDTDDGAVDEVNENILTPDSPFYFIKRFIENVRLLLTFDQEKKVELLEELAVERVKELAVLQQQYAEGELDEAQLANLEQALDDLVSYAERLVEELATLDDEVEQPEEDDEGEIGESEEGTDEDADEPGRELDKYEWRILHLQSVATRAPESAQKGLARAVANAERQRENAIAKGKLSNNETLEEENEDSEAEVIVDDNDAEVMMSGQVLDTEDSKGKKNSSSGKGKGNKIKPGKQK